MEPLGASRSAPRRAQYILFLFNALTILVAGARDSIGGTLADLWQAPELLIRGLPYAGTLLGILLAHELGHAWMAKRRGVSISLPYFFPAPTLFGTLGSLVMLRSKIDKPTDRRALFDMAVAGPVAGLLVTVPAAALGLYWSDPNDPSQSGSSNIVLGNSLLFHWLARLIQPDAADNLIALHPLAFAAWTGLFVTAMNLIPAGQLDGGHILYAMVGDRQPLISICILALLLIVGVVWHSPVLVVWVLIIFLLGLSHPAIGEGDDRIGHPRVALGLFLFAVLIAIFTVVPARPPLMTVP